MIKYQIYSSQMTKRFLHIYSALYGEKSWDVFIKNLNFFLTEVRKTSILDDMGVSKVFSRVNYSFK